MSPLILVGCAAMMVMHGLSPHYMTAVQVRGRIAELHKAKRLKEAV